MAQELLVYRDYTGDTEDGTESGNYQCIRPCKHVFVARGDRRMYVYVYAIMQTDESIKRKGSESDGSDEKKALWVGGGDGRGS